LSATGHTRRPPPDAGEFWPDQDLLASSSNLSKRSTPWTHVRLRQRPVPGGRPQFRRGAGRECKQWSQSDTSGEQKHPIATTVRARPRVRGARGPVAARLPRRAAPGGPPRPGLCEDRPAARLREEAEHRRILVDALDLDRGGLHPLEQVRQILGVAELDADERGPGLTVGAFDVLEHRDVVLGAEDLVEEAAQGTG